MNIFKKLQKNTPQDQPLMVGGVDGVETAQKPQRELAEYLYWIGLALMVMMLFVGYFFTSDLILQTEASLRKYHQTLEEKGTEQKNLEALQVLSAKVDTLKQDQEVVEMAIPFDARYDQVVAFLEYTMNRLKKQYLVFLPENIGWSLVSPDDLTNVDFQNMDIIEYSVAFNGEYDGFLAFLETLRNHERLMDVRSVGGLQTLEDGLVSAQVNFWAYSLPL